MRWYELICAIMLGVSFGVLSNQFSKAPSLVYAGAYVLVSIISSMIWLIFLAQEQRPISVLSIQWSIATGIGYWVVLAQTVSDVTIKQVVGVILAVTSFFLMN